MMLAGPSLRVVPLTVHIPLSDVPERLTIELIVAKARIVAFDMVEFMPERDIDGQGALVAAQLLAGTIGILARQEAAE